MDGGLEKTNMLYADVLFLGSSGFGTGLRRSVREDSYNESGSLVAYGNSQRHYLVAESRKFLHNCMFETALKATRRVKIRA